MNKTIKKVSGEGAYILSGIRNLISYCPEQISITVDGKEYFGYAAIIGKASRYGGNFKVTPDADIHDPFFSLCILTGNSRADLVRFAIGVIRGTHLSNPKLLYLKAAVISVQGIVHVQLDGDYFGTTPATFTVVQNAVRLVC
jgi:diacylglycerol kinase (ATP)